jgi:hypothetical protein
MSAINERRVSLIDREKLFSKIFSSFIRPRPTLNILEQFVKSADEANIHLNSIDKIKSLILECHTWNEKFEQMQQGEHYPFLSSYEQLYEQARHFHIDLEPLKIIEQTISQARTWLDKTQMVFRRTDSNLTLIEVRKIYRFLFDRKILFIR